MNNSQKSRPYFHISVVSQMLGLHPQTIRNYEKMGLIHPARTKGNVRLFSLEDVERVRKIHSYTNMGVNLAGVEIIMKLLDQMHQMEREMQEELERTRLEMGREIERLRKIIQRLSGDEDLDL